MDIQKVKLSRLTEAPYNPRVELKPGDAEYEKLKKSLEHFGYVEPIVVNKRNMTVIGGHQRLHVMKDLGMEEAEIVYVDLDENDEKALNVALNKISGEWDAEKLEDLMRDLDLGGYNIEFTGFSREELDTLYSGAINEGNVAIEEGSKNIEKGEDTRHGKEGGLLKICNGFFPFSILNTTSGTWIKREREWKEIVNKHIEKASAGREDNLTYDLARCGDSYTVFDKSGTSVFSMTLCELMYSWFACKGFKVFDPFAGGISRGFVASELGLEYSGIDLRKEQIDSNKNIMSIINKDISYTVADKCDYKCKDPLWICDDSNNMDKHVKDNYFDLVFTCPPYADLEVYSKDERDISNKKYDEFMTLFSNILRLSCKKLKDNRFFIIVIGEARDKKVGNNYGLVADTIKTMQGFGLHFYNEMILLNNAGTALFRDKKAFTLSRKIFKIHQNVLVFYKGDIQKIRDNFPSENIMLYDESCYTEEEEGEEEEVEDNV